MLEFKILTNQYELIQNIVKEFRNKEIPYEQAVRFLDDKTNIVYCCVDTNTNKVVGYILMYRLKRMDTYSDMLHIYHLFVNQNYQRQKIGQRLLKYSLDYALSEKLYYVYLITQTNNINAKALYEKMGGYNHPLNKELYYWYLESENKK